MIPNDRYYNDRNIKDIVHKIFQLQSYLTMVLTDT